MEKKEWSLKNENDGRLSIGDKVRTRGDMGGFNLTVVEIYNNHFCCCKGYGKLRHFNMNTLELVKKSKLLESK